LLGFGLELFDLRLCFGRHGLTMFVLGVRSVRRLSPPTKWGLRPILQEAQEPI
jgi:hypothetical protein